MEYTIDLIKRDIDRQNVLLNVFKNKEFSETYIKRIESLNKTLLILNEVSRMLSEKETKIKKPTPPDNITSSV